MGQELGEDYGLIVLGVPSPIHERDRTAAQLLAYGRYRRRIAREFGTISTPELGEPRRIVTEPFP